MGQQGHAEVLESVLAENVFHKMNCSIGTLALLRASTSRQKGSENLRKPPKTRAHLHGGVVLAALPEQLDVGGHHVAQAHQHHVARHQVRGIDLCAGEALSSEKLTE